MVELLCLANSYKKGGRCMAGLRTDGGGWVRPITDDEQGTLFRDHYHARSGRELQVLDVISLDLVEARPTQYQPENWLAAFPAEFIRITSPADVLALFEQNLHSHEPLFGGSYKRVPQSEFDDHPTSYSLALVEPDEVTIRIGTNYQGYKRGEAAFRFGDHEQYAISITDPNWQARCQELGFGNHSLSALGVGRQERVFFVVSLAEPFQEACYKVVAGVVVI